MKCKFSEDYSGKILPCRTALSHFSATKERVDVMAGEFYCKFVGVADTTNLSGSRSLMNFRNRMRDFYLNERQ